jgi:hypothetical protein
MKIRPYHRCLLLALVATADTDQIVQWLKESGWTGYSLVPEYVERHILEMKDQLLNIEHEDL